ncbi:MAG TPA: hypothetical protein VL486_08725 [Verrucomicrobiae bacterium]|nr:hypothetical protein [Verrucomicrobiae bacterium]
MLNRVFAGFIVVFWVAMMAALVRVEFFPQPLPLDRYPTRRVLKKIFANPEPVRLNVYYRGTYVGFCTVEIRPKLSGGLAEKPGPDQLVNGYDVSSMLQMTLPVFGMPSRLRLKSHSTFTPQLDLASFRMTTQINNGRVRIAGDDATKKVQVVFDMGDIHDERVFDFNQIQRTGFASLFGVPGLAGFSFPGSGGSPSSVLARSGTGESPSRPVTVTYFDRLEVAGSALRTFLIDSRINDHLWTKIWVSETDGAVLKVSTSLELEMVSNVLK